MTVAVIPGLGVVHAGAQSNRVISSLNAGLGVFRLPADPLFYATLTLRNVIDASRYRVTRADTGALLATGAASGTGDVVLTGVACYANPQEVDITVRNASGSTKYKVFDTTAFISRSGGEAYILQQQD